MANATPRDSRAGWDIFCSANGQIILDDLNEALQKDGYGPVSKRMLAHYRQMRDAGYTRYISINRFDVARASVPYQNASANGRYIYQDVDLPVSVVFAKGGTLFESFGRAREVGDVGALLIFDDEETMTGLQKLNPSPSNMVTVQFLDASRSVTGRIIESDVKSNPCTIEIEYTRLVSISSITQTKSLPTTGAGFVLVPSGDEEQTIDLFGRRIYNFFEVIEGARALINIAGSEQDHPVYASPPILDNLSVASPAEVVLQLPELVRHILPVGCLSGVIIAAGALIRHRKTWYEGTEAKNRSIAIDSAEKRAEREAQNRSSLHDLDVRERELDLQWKEAETRLRVEVVEKFRAGLPDSTLSVEDVNRIVNAQIIRPLNSLAQSGISDIREIRDQERDEPDKKAS